MDTGPGSRLEQLIAEFSDLLPMHGLLPPLSAAEVESFVALGERGRRLFHKGDLEGAENAFRGQLAIFAGNHEPFLSLALLEASRGDEKQALADLRAAVVRGFKEMRRVERSEAWSRMRKHPGFLDLVDAIPHLVEVESKWPDWELFEASRTPGSYESVRRKHEETISRIDGIAPALGPCMTARWKKLFDRVTAALLERYVAKRGDALDYGEALERLMAFYADGNLKCWQQLPRNSVRRLEEACDAMLRHAPDGRMRPVALVGLALARNSERDKRGALQEGAAENIREYLSEVMRLHFNSAVAPTAAVGLIRTDLESGRRDEAAARYRRLLTDFSSHTALLQSVREGLGDLALWLGGLPDFSADNLKGETINSASLGGKVTVIDFWATWCNPCIEEFTTMARIDERHGGDVKLLGVNLDSTEELTAEDLRAWVLERGVAGEHLHDGRGWDSELARLFGVKEIPFSVVVAPDGEVLAVDEHGKRLEKAVKAALRHGRTDRD
jgi:thiol-disulfide isomerase/thioredoxin